MLEAAREMDGTAVLSDTDNITISSYFAPSPTPLPFARENPLSGRLPVLKVSKHSCSDRDEQFQKYVGETNGWLVARKREVSTHLLAYDPVLRVLLLLYHIEVAPALADPKQ